MYNPTLYDIDETNKDNEQATLKPGALLYRIASLTHWRQNQVLTGEGAMLSKSTGRFHVVDQRTTYCANNVMVCLSELLFHTYRRFLDGVRKNQSISHLNSLSHLECRLVILSVNEIDDLVYIEAYGARTYDPRIVSSTIVFPDSVYGPLHELSNSLRLSDKSGVVYPSARHSVGFAFALFRDETSRIKQFYSAPLVTLQLIAEDQDMSVPPRQVRPTRERLHATMGYYSFHQPADIDDLKRQNLLNPGDLRPSGYIDFVRRQYYSYAHDACR